MPDWSSASVGGGINRDDNIMYLRIHELAEVCSCIRGSTKDECSDRPKMANATEGSARYVNAVELG